MKQIPLSLLLASVLGLAACNNGGNTTNTASSNAEPQTAGSNATANNSQRDFTIAATGGTYQDAIRTLYFKPFSEKIRLFCEQFR